MVEAHRKAYNHIVWHFDVVPEEELFLSGFINQYNKYRLKRIARKREAKGKSIKFIDYGMDFLAKDIVTNKYFVGQAKHYTSKCLSENGLGTFYGDVYHRVKSIGCLYTSSGKLTEDLRDAIINSDGRIVLHKLPFASKSDDTPVLTDETILPLRPYQKEAIECLLKPYEHRCDMESEESEKSEDFEEDNDSINESYFTNRKVLQLFTGGGKTVIAGHVLKTLKPKLIICIAPLRVSVQQLYDRTSLFLPEYQKLLVDSDTGGTTDEEEIKQKIQEHETKPLIIFSTYKSTEEILAKLITSTTSNMYLLVDEVHNMLSNDNLCNFANLFQNTLYLSATIPEELHDILYVDDTYTYRLNEAIKEGYCVDYNVYLPYLEINKETNESILDIQIPKELKDLDKDLCAKAQYLATGMLLNGLKHCLVYNLSIEDATLFRKVVVQVFERFHGLDIWCEQIDSSVSSSRRKQILEEFNKEEYHKIKIITSVRVLDEAVDMVKCDCQFITNVSYNFIRTAQRLGRGMRLDSSNPTKVNVMFLWCDDLNKAVNSLQILKHDDVDFHKKLRVLHGDYDRNDKKEAKDNVEEQLNEVVKFVNLKCLSHDEIWEMRRQEWIVQYEKLGRNPRMKGKNVQKDEGCAGNWMKVQRQIKYKMSEEKRNKLTNMHGWTWDSGRKKPDKYTWEEQLDHWKLMISKLERKPRQGAKDTNVPIDEARAGTWMSAQRRNKDNKDKMSEERRNILNNSEGWTWDDDKWEEQLDHWKQMYNRLERKPRARAKNVPEDESRAGNWMYTQRSNKDMSEERRQILTNTPGWSWDDGRKKPDKYSWEEQLDHWKQMYNRLERKPRKQNNCKNVPDDEARAGDWMNRVSQQRQNKDMSEERRQILTNTPGWTWCDGNKKQDKFTWKEQLDHWKHMYNQLERKPRQRGNNVQDNEARAGEWMNTQRQNKDMSEERRQILTNTPGWTWSGHI